MKGRKWKKVARVENEASLNFFFVEGEEPICHREGFLREKLPKPWNEVFLVLIKYLTLKGGMVFVTIIIFIF